VLGCSLARFLPMLHRSKCFGNRIGTSLTKRGEGKTSPLCCWWGKDFMRSQAISIGFKGGYEHDWWARQ
jgi:hypothetical protein